VGQRIAQERDTATDIAQDITPEGITDVRIIVIVIAGINDRKKRRNLKALWSGGDGVRRFYSRIL
jgi:hypothetical protein